MKQVDKTAINYLLLAYGAFTYLAPFSSLFPAGD